MVTTSKTTTQRPTGWVGWIAFAAAMMIIVGAFNAITGLVAIFSDEVYVRGVNSVLVFDVTTWGWIHLILGIAVAVVGYFLVQGALWANVVAALLVMLNMITQMLLLPAYPFWAMLIIVVDALVLWALLVHGDENVG